MWPITEGNTQDIKSEERKCHLTALNALESEGSCIFANGRAESCNDEHMVKFTNNQENRYRQQFLQRPLLCHETTQLNQVQTI